MTTPPHYQLTITDANGKQVRGKVVSLQPKHEQWHEGHTTVHIMTIEWLGPYRFPAIYRTPEQLVSGFFTIHHYQILGDGAYVFEGTFERASE